MNLVKVMLEINIVMGENLKQYAMQNFNSQDMQTCFMFYMLNNIINYSY